MLKVEEGKFYRIGDGRKAGPATASNDAGYPWRLPIQGSVGAMTFTDDGKWFRLNSTSIDLIAEWIDEPTADADGWITWDGGERPVDANATVEYRCGDHVETFEDVAGNLRWEWTGAGENDDIVAYRIIAPVVEPAPATRGATSSYAAASLIVNAVDATVTKSRDDREGYIASPREVDAADILIINGVVVRDRTPGGRDELVRMIPCVPRISPADWLDLEQLSLGPVTVAHGPAAEGMSGVQTRVVESLMNQLVTADLLAALKALWAAVDAGVNADPAIWSAAASKTKAAIDHAEGRGIRAQSFAERERDLLEANNRYLEEARDARRELEEARREINRYEHEVVHLNAEADRLSGERDIWQDKALTAEIDLDRVANRSDEERGMVWLIQQLGAYQRTLRAALPYAESRAEDMEQCDGAAGFGEKSEETVKAVAAVDNAKRLLGII